MQEWRLGSYELVRQLGEGGMAQVYLARDVRLGREVAVKVLDPKLAERPGFQERFLREARVAASLDHPNVVPLYDFGESGALFLVMPYISGGSLQDRLHRAPMPTGEVVTYGSQIADALDYAHHRNVVHRDVKPANMLVHADGRLMLADFGLAKILDATRRPAAPRGHPDAGTPEYMAPEQIEGRTEPRSDIYGLGVVLYLLLTGRLPFTGASSSDVMEGHLYRLPEPLRRLNPRVSPATEAVVLRALAKRPHDRFQRASDMGGALLSALIAGDVAPLPSAPRSSVPGALSLPPIISLGSVGSPSASGFLDAIPSMQRHTATTGVPVSFSTGLLPRLDTPLTSISSSGMHTSVASSGTPLASVNPAHSVPGSATTPAEVADSAMTAQSSGSSPASVTPRLGMSGAPSHITGVHPVIASAAHTPAAGVPVGVPVGRRQTQTPRTHAPTSIPPRQQRVWVGLGVAILIALIVLAALLLHWVQLHPGGIFL